MRVARRPHIERGKHATGLVNRDLSHSNAAGDGARELCRSEIADDQDRRLRAQERLRATRKRVVGEQGDEHTCVEIDTHRSVSSRSLVSSARIFLRGRSAHPMGRKPVEISGCNGAGRLRDRPQFDYRPSVPSNHDPLALQRAIDQFRQLVASATL
jgi:hypothetical protein